MHCYEYPRAALTVDAVVFSALAGAPCVLLVRRRHEPFAGQWALPGGYVEIDETLEAAAARELDEETGLRGAALAQLHTFGAVGRDPRGRSVTVAYWGRVAGPPAVRGGSDAAEAAWHRLDALPPMAFDHRGIVEYAEKAARAAGAV